ncbi:hypothetical protein [Streptomyces violaceorubidus]|nr:hypothetical protein [Streptomyces violaceorubidus]
MPTFTATIENPRRDRAGQGVGLRVSAVDNQGDIGRQTIPKAYTLR